MCANLRALDCEIADGHAVNVGRGSAASINRVARLFGGPTVHLPARPGDARHSLADCSRAVKILGWHPEMDTLQGIRELMASAGVAGAS